LPGVAQVAVVGVPDARWGEVGMAFVQPLAGVELDAAVLVAGLDGRLARFKIPRHVRVEAGLPLTASGKVDRVALRADALASVST
jgi:fatty-acyl-CoA synthase